MIFGLVKFQIQMLGTIYFQAELVIKNKTNIRK